MAWRYIAQRLTGDGPAEFLDMDVPLHGVQLSRALSGPAHLEASIPHEHARLFAADGRPLFEEWGTALFAEVDGHIRGGGILVASDFDGPAVRLDCVGFSGYPKGMPWSAEGYYGVQVDPLDMVRKIWDHLQGMPGGNLGLVVDPTTSDVRIGQELEQVEFDTQSGPVSFEAGPFKLAWYVETDLGSKIDTLAKETPFDYLEEHSWDSTRSTIEHRLRLHYPRVGRRRTDLRFALGENVLPIPPVSRDGEEYASEVVVLGSGEGRDMVRGDAGRTTGRLRRVAVVADKSLRSTGSANEAARRELAYRLGEGEIAEITVSDHPNARLGSVSLGDEILVEGDTGWVDLNIWCRVVGETVSPDGPPESRLRLIRSEAA